MSAADRHSPNVIPPPGSHETYRQAVSALVDGELSSDELDALLRSGAEHDRDERWETYHLIGEVLRGSQPALAQRIASRDFVAGVCGQLQAPHEASLPVSVEVPLIRGNAANDALFRWKLVAGLASVAAVAAVGWSLVGSVGGAVSAGPQLAVNVPSTSPAGVPLTLVTPSPQGPMVRDARLEQLLSEHRQYGGMSALQMPTGFLRNATYDAAPQR